MRKLIISAAVALALSLGAATPAFAHVHAITPLLDCGQANDNAGGNGTNGTPADDANGGPIVGVIPINTGNSPLLPFEGGFGATDGNCPDN